MRFPEPIIAEGIAYVVIAIFAALVIANAARPPHDPISPDFYLSQRN